MEKDIFKFSWHVLYLTDFIKQSTLIRLRSLYSIVNCDEISNRSAIERYMAMQSAVIHAVCTNVLSTIDMLSGVTYLKMREIFHIHVYM